MNSPRFALVAMLLAVEVLLLGMMIAALRGGSLSGGIHAAGLHAADSMGKTFAPLDVGSAPHVQIDDPNSGVYVSASSDGLVHVIDESHVHGFILGGAKFAPLAIARTSDGVRIMRPESSGQSFSVIGITFQRIRVQVPAGSHVDVTRSSAVEVRGMRNAVDAVSQDGHIALSDIQGDIRAHSDDGHIDATDVSGNAIALSTQDGHMRLRNVTANSLDAKTADGRIDASNLFIDGSAPRAVLHSDDGSLHISGRFAGRGSYDFSTGDGRVELALAPGTDLTVDASTNSGHIYVDGSSYGDGDATTHSIRVGSGTGTMHLASQDGSIRITTNGAV